MDGGGDGTENWSIVKPPTNHYFILFFDAFLREAIKNLFINSMCFFLGGGDCFKHFSAVFEIFAVENLRDLLQMLKIGQFLSYKNAIWIDAIRSE